MDLNQLARDAARRAHLVFEAEGWQYGGIITPLYRPTAADLEAMIAELLGEVSAGHNISSGRLCCHREDDGEHYRVTLEIGEFTRPAVQR